MFQSCEATMSHKRALTDSSSSEASMKATLQQDRTDNTHLKVSPEITTSTSHTYQSCSGKLFITKRVQNVGKHLESKQIYSSLIVAAEG